ncbi:hypothetical protein [Amycolatopsis sp. cmx-11-12]|uniref:hypothetical protein n=1 Tax=Amycolatopsis sp. cmx-11-12 TaxID=2785795 RepID=UPI00391742DA
MFANWVQIAELVLLPVGLGIGYAAGRTSRQDEHTSFDGEITITHPGLVQEYQYPTRDPFIVDRSAH